MIHTVPNQAANVTAAIEAYHIGEPYRTFKSILSLARNADCLHWSRDSETLSLITDDMPNDRRTCVDVRIKSMRCEVKTVCGYGKNKPGQWAEYCSPRGDVKIQDKRGLKDLMTWIHARAEDQTGCPNPASFSLYKRSKGNYID